MSEWLKEHAWKALPNPTQCILPRSLQRPMAVTDGSLIENLNKISVRLWT
jgi:hypothetical protein